jgi:hypothetical protein
MNKHICEGDQTNDNLGLHLKANVISSQSIENVALRHTIEGHRHSKL